MPITITEADIAFDFLGLRPLIECDLAFGEPTPAGIVTYYWTYAVCAARRLCRMLFAAFRGGYGKRAEIRRKAIAAGRQAEMAVLDWKPISPDRPIA